MKKLTAISVCAAALLLPQVSAAPQIPAPGKGEPVSLCPDGYSLRVLQLSPEQEVHIQKLITSSARVEVSRSVGKRIRTRVIVEGEELDAIRTQLRQVEQWYSYSHQKQRPADVPLRYVVVKLYDEQGNEIACFSRSNTNNLICEKCYIDASGKPVPLIDLFEAFLPCSSPPSATRAGEFRNSYQPCMVQPKPCRAFLNLRGRQVELLEEPLRCPKVPRGKCRFDFPQKQ